MKRARITLGIHVSGNKAARKNINGLRSNREPP